jgi:aryl-alcohol dehydrogenase-like predicted oxidoreductase
MIYRQLGRSDVQVSAITFGAWAIGGWMWGPSDDEAALAAIRKAANLGITTIDTAPIDGTGHSEEIVGKAVAEIGRDKVQVLTKYGLVWTSQEGESSFEGTDRLGKPIKVCRNAGKASVLRECERSLRRLGSDYIDLYQCHWRDPTTPVEETMEAMEKLLKDGKIRAAGVSNFSVEEIAAANACLPIASDQPPYSLLRRDIERDILPYCREQRIGVLAYSPLERGLLTGKVPVDRIFDERDLRSRAPRFRSENRRRVLAFLDRLRPIAESHDATLAQLVICWTIHQPGITAALVGARDARQVEENAKAADLQLAEDEMQQIAAEAKQVALDL